MYRQCWVLLSDIGFAPSLNVLSERIGKLEKWGYNDCK